MVFCVLLLLFFQFCYAVSFFGPIDTLNERTFSIRIKFGLFADIATHIHTYTMNNE